MSEDLIKRALASVETCADRNDVIRELVAEVERLTAGGTEDWQTIDFGERDSVVAFASLKAEEEEKGGEDVTRDKDI
tara:strand:+ start:324 stop:554 length:231 start_codon:yes stop_codon:yes gene_type:complete